jgi:hypothetical protein
VAVIWADLRKICEAGGPLPAAEPVDAGDLRRYWEFGEKIRAQHPSPAGEAIGIDLRVIEAELPSVDLVAMWLRAASLSVLQGSGALREWERGTELDDVVFQVAATFPFEGNHIDVELFRQQLQTASREGSGGS